MASPKTKEFLRQSRERMRVSRENLKKSGHLDDSPSVNIFESPTKTYIPSPHRDKFRNLQESEDFIRILSQQDQAEFLVPREIALQSGLISRMFEGVGFFKECSEQKVSLPFRGEVLEKIFRYLFEDYILNFTSIVKRNLFGPPKQTNNVPSSDLLNADVNTQFNQLPRIVFLVEMTPALVTEILMASHYLYIPSLVDISCKMIASYINEVETLEGVPPEVVLQIYGYLDADKLLEIENSELHQQIASTIDDTLVWKKMCEQRGWEPHEWQGITYSWNDAISEFKELYHLCPNENSIHFTWFSDLNYDTKNNNPNCSPLNNSFPWKLMFVHREFCRRLHSFTTFDQNSFQQLLIFQKNCSKLMTQLQMIPTFVQTSRIDPLYWIDKLPNLEELDMSGNKISVSTMNQLIELFKRGAVPKLCKLKLSNTSLNDEAVLPLLLFLEESTQQTSQPRITSLDLSQNLLHNTSLRFLATRILAHNTTIRFLSLRENEFVSPDDRSGLRFTRALYTGDDADAVPEVLSSLKTNSTLIFLDLSGNAISFENVSAADWHNFSENRSLVYLLLANTRVGKGVDDRSVAKTFEKFMTSLPKTLRFLDLAHNELEGNVLEKIALVLEKNQNIVHLDLSDNFFGYSSAVHLSHILQMAQSLKSLNFGKNYLTDAGGKEIARTIGYNRNLVKLNLESNRLGNSALEIVKNILSHQSTMHLRYLNLNTNNMSGNVFSQIGELFQNNTKIKLILDHLQ